MARGVRASGLNDATQITQMNQGLEAGNQAQLGQLTSAYTGLLNGTSPLATAQTQATMGGLGGTYDQLFSQAKNTAARTGNQAGVAAGLDKLATTKGAEGAQLAAQNVVGQQDTALKGLQGLYGMNTDLLSKSLGVPAEYLNASTAGQNASPWNNFLKALGTGAAGALTSPITALKTAGAGA